MAFITPLFYLLKKSISNGTFTSGLLVNILVSFLFVFFRKFPPICSNLPQSEDGDGCTFCWKEVETFMFLICVMVVKNRSAVSVQQMILSILMYAKLANAVLFYRLDFRFCFVYCVICVVRLWLSPEDFKNGPDNMMYFSDKGLEEELESDTRITWVMLFYVTWSPQCTAMAPVFTTLSEKYTGNFLKFGKVDIGKYPGAGKKYGVSTSTMSRQLPTVIVFENGKPSNWRPMLAANKKNLVKYVFSQDNMERDFAFAKLAQESRDKSEKFHKLNKKME